MNDGNEFLDTMTYPELLNYCEIPDEEAHNYDRLTLIEMARSINEMENNNDD